MLREVDQEEDERQVEPAFIPPQRASVMTPLGFASRGLMTRLWRPSTYTYEREAILPASCKLSLGYIQIMNYLLQ